MLMTINYRNSGNFWRQNIIVGPPNDEIKKHEIFSYNEKLYVCVPEQRKLDVSKL